NALETKRFRETHKKQLPTDRVQFYQGRNDPGRPRLHDVINGASLVWIATHTAGNIRNSDLLRHPIERLILLDPNGVALESLSQITLDRTADQLRNEINQSIVIATTNKVPVKVFNGPVTSIIIGNPQSGNGWVEIEQYFPWSRANDRPGLHFNQNQYP